MKKFSAAALRFLSGRDGLLVVLAAFTALFQIFLLTRVRAFYPVLRVVFALLVLQLMAAFGRAASRRKALWLVLFLIVLVRVPFLLHADGALITSDNAVDGLQPLEMRDSHTAPFFLLGAVKHMGTIKQLVVAFLMDLVGNRYLAYLLVQLLVYAAVLFVLYDLVKDSLPQKPVFLLVFFGQFAFIETVFDFSLSMRGSPYLEMLLFILLGAGLVERGLRSPWRSVLGYYFLFFSIYIHPLGAVLVGSFGLVFLIRAFLGKRFWANALAAGAGLLAGLGHWFYYLLYLPKPVASGGWEQMGLLPLSNLSLSYLGEYAGILRTTFTGLFNFEFAYNAPIYLAGRQAVAGFTLNQAVILLSAAVTLAGIGLALRRVVRLLARRQAAQPGDWPWILEVVLAGAFAAKAFLFYPPHMEPRHNFDLVFLIMLSYMLVAAAWAERRPKRRPWAAALALVLAGLGTAPHYLSFYQVVRYKETSYRRILSVLERGHVQALATDFIIAYPIYFLSDRTIKVSDTLGPFTVHDFYPGMSGEVDALPADRKAYLFFSERAPNRPWHKEATEVVFRRTLADLTSAGISYRTHKLRDYIIVIPRRRG